LSNAEAARRLKKYGENIVVRRRKIRPIAAFIKKFNSPLLLTLVFASVISLAVGEPANAAILLVTIFISAVLDFVNTYKSEKAVEKLIARVVTTATVMRSGARREIEIKYIVPGDAIFLSAGDIVPADGEVLESRDFFVNQSALTGESFPVEKEAATDNTGRSAAVFERGSLVFMGTSVVTGYATVSVLKTGMQTAFGSIASRLVKAEPETDFEKNIKGFSYFITQVTLFLVSFVFLINAFMGRGWLSSFIFSLAIAIGLTPELLPVIISVSLSHGSVNMAKKEVIVKNLSSIQNLGSMNILCTDKTGTITENRIVLVKYVDGDGTVSDEVLQHAYLNSNFHTGVQNPLDNAVRTYRPLDVTKFKKIDEIPFDFQRRRDSMVVADGKRRRLIAKGAPEEIFKICTHYQHQDVRHTFSPTVRAQTEAQFRKLSLDGFRVLAVAVKTVAATASVYSVADEIDMSFLGFVAFMDPPKDTATAAIHELADLGIEVKFLTGDNEVLTEKVCRDIKLPVRGVLTGTAVAKMNDAQLQRAVLDTTIFARIDPEQKERIILRLKAAGQAVGYLGDGINDAPALKAADVGITVNNAVDVAKETADIILLHKSLRVLKDGVVEGRRTFQNTMKYIMMGLSSNFGNMFSMMGASIFLPFFPMLPGQVLVNNFLYDTSQLSLPTDTVDNDEIRRPSTWSLPFIRKYMLTFGPVSSVFDFLTFAVLYWGFRVAESQFQTGWFIESIATQIFVIYVIRTKKIPFLQSRPSRLLLANTLLIVAVAWALPFTPLGGMLGFSPLPLAVVATLFIIVCACLALAEIVKRFFYRMIAGKVN